MWPLQILAAAAAAAAVAAASRPAAVLSPVTRTGSTLLVDGKPWKAVGPNVYWLGLDENVVPPEGEPYDPVTKSSYPAKGRITDVLATVRALGGTMIRSHTLGISLGNPLSVMPVPGVVNDAAFASIDWAVYQAGQYGIRLMIPLIDNFVRRSVTFNPLPHLLAHELRARRRCERTSFIDIKDRITTMGGSTPSCGGPAST